MALCWVGIVAIDGEGPLPVVHLDSGGRRRKGHSLALGDLHRSRMPSLGKHVVMGEDPASRRCGASYSNTLEFESRRGRLRSSAEVVGGKKGGKWTSNVQRAGQCLVDLDLFRSQRLCQPDGTFPVSMLQTRYFPLRQDFRLVSGGCTFMPALSIKLLRCTALVNTVRNFVPHRLTFCNNHHHRHFYQHLSPDDIVASCSSVQRPPWRL